MIFMNNEVQSKKLAKPYQDGSAVVLVVGDNGFLKISKDGKNWQDVGHFTDMDLTAITFSQTARRFVCLGANKNGQNASFVSEDGENWQAFQNTSARARRLLWCGAKCTFIAIGKAGIIETSCDGKYWRRAQSPVGTDLSGLVWNDLVEEFVVVGGQAVLTSKNGREWQQVNTNINYNLCDVAWSPSLNQGQGLYVAVTSQKNIFLTSPDAKTWTVKHTDAMEQPNWSVLWCDVLYNYISTGHFYTICTSPDGINWKKRVGAWADLNEDDLVNIIWSKEFQCLFAVDHDGYVYSSTNGAYWNYQSADDWKSLNAIATGVAYATGAKTKSHSNYNDREK